LILGGWVFGVKLSDEDSRFRSSKGCCHGNHFWLSVYGVYHWRHLKNTTEPSMCGGDAALCQITFTTCYVYRPSSVVCLSVCHDIASPAKTAEPIEMPFRMKTRVWVQGTVCWMGSISRHIREAIFTGKVADPTHAWTCSTVDILKVTRQGAEPVRCGRRLGCTRWGAHWRNLANTTELSACVGNAALCQITLSTC